MKEYAESFVTLAAKDHMNRDESLLGNRPVSVIQAQTERDFERLYEAGVAKGNGTKEQRAACREMLKTWHEKNMELQHEILEVVCDEGLHVEALLSGHHVQLTQPDVITSEVKRILSEWKKQKS
jgi:hypothetical protein